MSIFRIQRVIPAAPERVYRAWLDPDTLASWSAPGGYDVIRHEVDEHVGGRYRCWQINPAGEEMGYEAEILELVPNERIVFRWFYVAADRVIDETAESRLTVVLAPVEGGATLLTVIHDNLEGLADADAVQSGWSEALNRFVDAL